MDRLCPPHGTIWPGCWGERKNSSFAKENCGQTVSSTAFGMAQFGQPAGERKKLLICQRKLWTDCVLHSLWHGTIWPACWGEKKTPHLPKKIVYRLCPPHSTIWPGCWKPKIFICQGKLNLHCTVLLPQDFSLNRQYLHYPRYMGGAEPGQN